MARKLAARGVPKEINAGAKLPAGSGGKIHENRYDKLSGTHTHVGTMAGKRGLKRHVGRTHSMHRSRKRR